MLLRYVAERLGDENGSSLFRFLVLRCDRTVMAVLERLAVIAAAAAQRAHPRGASGARDSGEDYDSSITSRTARSSCAASTGLAQ
jgi:hypothetical protein